MVGGDRCEREAGETESVLRRQVGAIPVTDALVIATSRVGDRHRQDATPSSPKRRRVIKELHPPASLRRSVKAGECQRVLGQPAVDGALVGGASLEAASFAAICLAAAAIAK